MFEQTEKFLEGCRELYKRGNKWCLAQAIEVCARENLVLPKWAATAYIRAFHSVQTAEFESWDDVFGKIIPARKHPKAVHKDRTTMWPLFNMIREIKEAKPEMPIDTYLFERVGKVFGVGKTKAQELYYKAKKQHDKIFPAR